MRPLPLELLGLVLRAEAVVVGLRGEHLQSVPERLHVVHVAAHEPVDRPLGEALRGAQRPLPDVGLALHQK